MKRRILNYKIPAVHDSITALGTLSDNVSISDFDAFIFDPQGFQSEHIFFETFMRRQRELAQLIAIKAGLVICLLRPDGSVSIQGGPIGATGRYSILASAAQAVETLITETARLGEGSRLSLVSSARGPTSEYFRILRDKIRFHAYLEASSTQIDGRQGRIFALNSIGYPIACEFPVGQGLMCFVPSAPEASPEHLGAALTNMVAYHLKGPGEIAPPSWAANFPVPGATLQDNRLTELAANRDKILEEISQLQAEKSNLVNYQRLLFGTGKTVLEPIVRSALRLLGFQVPEPESYEGEWDAEIREPESARTALVEIEGSENAINIDKYRQLNEYVDSEALQGRNHKGILVGNGFKSTDPSAPERQQQFTDAVIRGAERNHFSLVPTTELFRAVCKVLENPDEREKNKIRNSILETIGPWTL